MCRKGAGLLHRTSHACLPHPTKKQCLLVVCGYSGSPHDYLSDIVLFDTERLDLCSVQFSPHLWVHLSEADQHARGGVMTSHTLSH